MDSTDASEDTLRVRFWASARAAAGTDLLEVPVEGELTLAELVDRLVADGGDRGLDTARLAQVLGVCSVLVGDEPHGRGDRSARVPRGATVEFLPPFAGG